MQILENVSLKPEHTFHLDVRAKYFVEITSEEDLKALLDDSIFQNNRHIVIGRGSNILFVSDYDGLVIKVNIRGIAIAAENDAGVTLSIGAGEPWHELVLYAAEKGWGGIENLALIPGTVGAAVVQNIGAYGQNFEDVFVRADAFDIENGTVVTFDKAQCAFGYRTSVFKNPDHRQYILLRVYIELRKNPTLELSYKSRYESLESELAAFAQAPYGVKDVAQAIINIRSRKLPNPDIAGNAGSFFKNPVVSKEKIIALQKELPGLPFYPTNAWSSSSRDITSEPDDAMFKIPAAWLLEDMGWKGKRVGDCGTWPTQPLSIVNYGAATADELLTFVESVREAVKNRYGITLENEVEIIR